ncbi:hypothetical protein CO610_05925 [Lysobacteraceae bacterium NML95-0200]|nr:hypothetical protein CO610_05925 [Xanthomonadaceae bacterium NML95-0200]
MRWCCSPGASAMRTARALPCICRPPRKKLPAKTHGFLPLHSMPVSKRWCAVILRSISGLTNAGRSSPKAVRSATPIGQIAIDMTQPNPPVLPYPNTDTWHPLPARGRILFCLSHAIGLAILGAALALAASLLNETSSWLWAGLLAVAGLLAGALFGIWLGARRHSYYRWRLDETGFAVKSGKLWQSHTHVPATRVQHLDISRGPLQRHYRLATLTVHTAGTHGHAVSLPCLDGDAAEALRAALARRIEPESDAD